MKQLNLFIAIILCSTSAFSQGFIYGSATDSDTKEPLIATNISLSQNGKFITGTVADLDGFYSLSIEPGTYDIEFSFIGFQNKIINDIKVTEEEELELNAELKAGINLETVVVIAYQTPCIGGCTDICCYFLSPECFATTVQDTEEDSKIISSTPKTSTNIFPNPASSSVTIAAAKNFTSIKILSADSKIVFQQNNIYQNKIEIQVDNWVAGIYFVYYLFDDETAIERLMVGKKLQD